MLETEEMFYKRMDVYWECRCWRGYFHKMSCAECSICGSIREKRHKHLLPDVPNSYKAECQTAGQCIVSGRA